MSEVIEQPEAVKPMDDPRVRMLNIDELSATVGLAPSVIYERVKAGKFPNPIKIGRRNLWRSATIATYLEREDRRAGNGSYHD